VTIMEQGPAGAYNVLSLGTQGNKVLHVLGAAQRVGIGTDAPTAPLGFGPTVGKKITLYPGVAGDYGFGISGGRMQIFSEAAATDVAIGYDAAGTFNERFAFKNNGALAVGGSTGAAGQVLQSNGSAAAPTWASPSASLNSNIYQVVSNGFLVMTTTTPETTVPDLSQTFSVATPAKVITSFSVPIYTPSCFACGASTVYFDIRLDGVMQVRYSRAVGNGQNDNFAATLMVPVAAGTHTISIVALSPISQNATLGCNNCSLHSTLTLQVVPQ
jgi:hypothetical protein